eukprot:SAG25_NODE_1405_length_3102_cov_3.122877_1_plen_57_part_10
MMRIKDDQISILSEHNTLYKRRIKELTKKLKALQQYVVAAEASEAQRAEETARSAAA